MEATNSIEEIPDILKPIPLARAVDVEVETNILEPVSHIYTSRDGGRTRWVLPAKAVLNAPNAAMVFEIVNGEGPGQGTDRRLAFPLMSGGVGMIQRITVRCGSQILSQIDYAGQYNTVKNIFKSQAYKSDVLDVRHHSQNNIKTKILANQSGSAALAGATLGQGLIGYHQVSNNDIDIQNTWGKPIISDADVHHLFMKNKLLRDYDNRGKGPECVIRLGDIMNFFEANNLPLGAMAQTEIECEWKAGPSATDQYQNIIDSPVIVNKANLGAATAGLNIGFAAPPVLQLDYIHYPEEEMMKIQEQVNRGMALNFTEVVTTFGVNPELGAVANGNYNITSNHILGMAGKEVKKIYVQKNLDKKSTQGAVEKDYTQGGCQTHRNQYLWDFKSVQCPSEVYNFVVNNERMYGIDISNPAQAYNQLQQCEQVAHILPAQFDTKNFDANVLNILNNTKDAGTVDNAANDSAFSQRMLGGCMNVIGLNLDKYNSLDMAGGRYKTATPGNGERIGSAPIEFRYTCNKTRDGGTPANENRAAVNLTFFIEFRRALIINNMGVSVSDA
jgi:hypothetical protein